MSGEIPQWALDRALELARPEGVGRGAGVNDGRYYSDMKEAFARYIAAHEEPPVDPLLIEAREIVAASMKEDGSFRAERIALTRSGGRDDHIDVRAVLTGLRRGVEIAKAGQP